MVANKGKTEALSLQHVRTLTSRILQNNDFNPDDLGLVPMNAFLSKGLEGNKIGDFGPRATCSDSREVVLTRTKYHNDRRNLDHLTELGTMKNSPDNEQIHVDSDVADTSIHEHSQSDFLEFPEDPQASLRCRLCNLVCGSPVDLEAHLAGKKHRKALRCQEAPQPLHKGSGSEHAAGVAHRSSPPVSDRNFHQARCNLCNINYSGPANIESHLKGKRHRKMVASVEAVHGTYRRLAASVVGMHSFSSSPPIHVAPVVAASVAERQTTCALCNIACTSPVCLAQHLAGRRHRNAAAQKEARFQIDSLFSSDGMRLESANSSVPNEQTGEYPAVGRTEHQIKMPPRKEAVENLDSLNYGVAGVTIGRSLSLLPCNTIPSSQDLACRVCAFLASSRIHLCSHLAGKRHRRAIEELELRNKLSNMTARSNVTQTDYSPSAHADLTCDPCAVSCSSFTVLMAHLKGKRHRRTIARREAVKKIEGLMSS